MTNDGDSERERLDLIHAEHVVNQAVMPDLVIWALKGWWHRFLAYVSGVLSGLFAAVGMVVLFDPLLIFYFIAHVAFCAMWASNVRTRDRIYEQGQALRWTSMDKTAIYHERRAELVEQDQRRGLANFRTVGFLKLFNYFMPMHVLTGVVLAQLIPVPAAVAVSVVLLGWILVTTTMKNKRILEMFDLTESPHGRGGNW